MRPDQRLDHILGDEHLRGFPPFGALSGQPMVCFSESPSEHLRHLLADLGWQPWGLVLTRDFVYRRGGGPVWYAGPAQYDQLRDDQRPWAVPLGKSNGSFVDWTHEREWRVPGSVLDFGPADIQAVLVGDPDWKPTPVQYEETIYISGQSGQELAPGDPTAQVHLALVTRLPNAWLAAERWCWDSSAQRIINLQNGHEV